MKNTLSGEGWGGGGGGGADPRSNRKQTSYGLKRYKADPGILIGWVTIH